MLRLSCQPARASVRFRLAAWTAVVAIAAAVPAAAASPSFTAFHARAQAGDRLTVVFYGASLTWGANATDQNYFSYRARIAARLTDKYPLARFIFHDAAIGGTGSQLGVFRLDRDVLSRKPDLVFVDFTAAGRAAGGEILR